MLLEVLREIGNFFIAYGEYGEFAIYNSEIEVYGNYLPGQYIAITGSILNNGVYRIESVTDGVISFIIVSNEYPAWVQPMGAIDAYKIGDRVTHNNERFVSLINANVYVPGTDVRWWEPLHDEFVPHLLVDEKFDGAIYGLRIPKDLLELIAEIEVFQQREGKASLNISESFGVQSFSRATGANGAVLSWREVFGGRLSKYRKMFADIEI